MYRVYIYICGTYYIHTIYILCTYYIQTSYICYILFQKSQESSSNSKIYSWLFLLKPSFLPLIFPCFVQPLGPKQHWTEPPAEWRSLRSDNSMGRYIRAFSSSVNSTFTGSSIFTSFRWAEGVVKMAFSHGKNHLSMVDLMRKSSLTGGFDGKIVFPPTALWGRISFGYSPESMWGTCGRPMTPLSADFYRSSVLASSSLASSVSLASCRCQFLQRKECPTWGPNRKSWKHMPKASGNGGLCLKRSRRKKESVFQKNL